ncbi:hypothetical protein BaRGS_00018458 [Batillaria attramentaria]|uniref:CUB domain-containing protein n=1 Tax=Batillaria attramentaria TaxID=370345 RepID=A0ABD0KT04_9CAEN
MLKNVTFCSVLLACCLLQGECKKPCALFKFSDSSEVVHAVENTTVDLEYTLDTSDCLKKDTLDFSIIVSKKASGDSYDHFCNMVITNGTCRNPLGKSGCSCLSKSGSYRFKKTVERRDNGILMWWTTNSIAEAKDIVFDVQYPAQITAIALTDHHHRRIQGPVSKYDTINIYCHFLDGNPSINPHLVDRNGKTLPAASNFSVGPPEFRHVQDDKSIQLFFLEGLSVDLNFKLRTHNITGCTLERRDKIYNPSENRGGVSINVFGGENVDGTDGRDEDHVPASDPSDDGDNDNTVVIAGVSGAAGFLVLIIIVIVAIKMRGRRGRDEEDEDTPAYADPAAEAMGLRELDIRRRAEPSVEMHDYCDIPELNRASGAQAPYPENEYLEPGPLHLPPPPESLRPDSNPGGYAATSSYAMLNPVYETMRSAYADLRRLSQRLSRRLSRLPPPMFDDDD